MKTITLDASSWRTIQDFYDAILPQLRAPEWHGANLNALVESMVWGGINRLDPPYEVAILNSERLPPNALEEIREIANFTLESCAEFRERKGRDPGVSFKILS